MANKFLVLKLDRYAGNVDELVCTALTGYGADRYGEKQARKVFDAKVLPLLKSDSEYPELPVEFVNFKTEYGMMPYELDSSYTNNLRLGLDEYTNDAMIEDMLDIWDLAYSDGQGNLVITVDGIHDKSVTTKIIGYDLVKIGETRKILR